MKTEKSKHIEWMLETLNAQLKDGQAMRLHFIGKYVNLHESQTVRQLRIPQLRLQSAHFDEKMRRGLYLTDDL